MKTYFNWFELTLIGIVSLISLFFCGQAFAAGGDIMLVIIDLVTAICGIFSVVLCAKGKKSGFIFGLVNVIFYAVISFMSAYYGEVMLNTLFYIPMNIISYFLWKNKEDSNHNAESRALTLPQLGLGVVGVAGLTYLYHLLLTSLGGAMTLLDGTTTILSIVATILMAARFAEQWVCWIIVDVITVILWILAANPVMVVMWSAYTINAIYGYIIWLARSGKINWSWANHIAANA